MDDFRLLFRLLPFKTRRGLPPNSARSCGIKRENVSSRFFLFSWHSPYPMNAPAVRLKRFDIAPVTLDVAFEFRNPVLLIAFRHGRLAVWTAVPKASVDEQGHLFTRIGDVGTPRNAPLKTIARKAFFSKPCTHEHFRLRILPLVTAHALAPAGNRLFRKARRMHHAASRTRILCDVFAMLAFRRHVPQTAMTRLSLAHGAKRTPSHQTRRMNPQRNDQPFFVKTPGPIPRSCTAALDVER